MKLQRKLWILTPFLALMMVILSVTLVQSDCPDPGTFESPYNLTGRWSMKEIEVCYDFCDGTKEVDPQDAYDVCICHDISSFSYPNIWIIHPSSTNLMYIGRTGSYLIGFGSAVLDDDQDAFTGSVNRNADFIRGQFIYNASDDQEPCTGVNRFSMTGVPPDPYGTCDSLCAFYLPSM